MQTEQEHIFIAQPLIHLDICTVKRANGDCAVEHKLHVARSGGLLAGGGYLLGNLSCRHESFRCGNAVVFHEIDLQPALAQRVAVDIVCKRQDELDYALCGAVSRRRLCAEHKGSRRKLRIGVCVQHILQARNEHGAQKLTLILVQTLDLNIEYCVGVELKAVLPAGKGGKILLV